VSLGAFDLVGAGETLFFTARGDGNELDKVLSFAFDGGSVRELVRLDASVEPEGIAAAQAFVCWASRVANTIGRTKQDGGERANDWQRSVAPRRITLDDDKVDGSGRVDVATGLDHPIGLAQDAAAIYFTERAAGRIWRTQK
jgi:hypothetical protein